MPLNQSSRDSAPSSTYYQATREESFEARIENLLRYVLEEEPCSRKLLERQLQSKKILSEGLFSQNKFSLPIITTSNSNTGSSRRNSSPAPTSLRRKKSSDGTLDEKKNRRRSHQMKSGISPSHENEVSALRWM